ARNPPRSLNWPQARTAAAREFLGKASRTRAAPRRRPPPIPRTVGASEFGEDREAPAAVSRAHWRRGSTPPSAENERLVSAATRPASRRCPAGLRRSVDMKDSGRGGPRPLRDETPAALRRCRPSGPAQPHNSSKTPRGNEARVQRPNLAGHHQ